MPALASPDSHDIPTIAARTIQESRRSRRIVMIAPMGIAQIVLQKGATDPLFSN